MALVFPGSSADGSLEENDVILEVEGHTISNDGSVALDDLLVDSAVLVDRLQSGESLSVRVLREGERLDAEIPLTPYPPLMRYRAVYDELPTYYVYAGLVFAPMTRNLLGALGDTMAPTLLYEYTSRSLAEPERLQRDMVVLLRRLDHPVNADMAWHAQLLVERVNGREITSLEDLVEAIETNAEEFHVFDFAYFGRFGVMRSEEADAVHAEILERYGVPEDRRL